LAASTHIPGDFSHSAPQEQRILELKIEFAEMSKNPSPNNGPSNGMQPDLLPARAAS
jgi:hypothetical protein